MITYVYVVKCPEREDEFFDFFNDAKGCAMDCLANKPIITQTEVNRNDFCECTEYKDLGQVWSWEDLAKDSEVTTGISEDLGDFDDFDVGPQSDEFAPVDFDEFAYVEDDTDEAVKEAMTPFHRDLINSLTPMTKDEFQERLQSEETVTIFTGDPREFGIRGRTYDVSYYDGKYEVSYWDETYEDEFTESEEVEEFDTLDDLWAYMIEFMEDGDFTPTYNYLTEAPITEATEPFGDLDMWVALNLNKGEDLVVACMATSESDASRLLTAAFRERVPGGDPHDCYIRKADEEDLEYINENPSVLAESSSKKPIPEGMTIDQLKEEMEANESEVECAGCEELFEKEECFYKEGIGYLCGDCEDRIVRCTWCEDLFDRYECDFEADMGWLCDRCQSAITSRGERLTIITNPTEEDFARVMTEAVQEDTRTLAELVKDSINHLTNDLGKDPWADDFADDVIGDIERNYKTYVPEDVEHYNHWCSEVASEVSRQINSQLDEAADPKEVHDLGNEYDGGYPEEEKLVESCPTCGKTESFDAKTSFCNDCGFQ